MDHHTWYQSIDYRENSTMENLWFERELESTTRQQAYQYSPSSYYQPPPTERQYEPSCSCFDYYNQHYHSTIESPDYSYQPLSSPLEGGMFDEGGMFEEKSEREGEGESCRFGVTMEEFSRSIDERFAAHQEEIDSVKVEMKEMKSKLDLVVEMMKKIQDHTLNPKGKEVEEIRSSIHVQQAPATYLLPDQHQDRKQVQDQLDTLKQPDNHDLPSSISSKDLLVHTLTGVDVVRKSANQDMSNDVRVYGIQQEMIETTKEEQYEVQCINEHKVFDEMPERQLNGTNKEVHCSFYYYDLVNVLIVFDDVFVPEISDWKVIMNGYRFAYVRGVRAWYVSNDIWPLKIFRNNMVSSKDDGTSTTRVAEMGVEPDGTHTIIEQHYEGYGKMLDNMSQRYQTNYNVESVRLLALELIKKLKSHVVITGMTHFEATTSSAFEHLLNVTREIGSRLFLKPRRGVSTVLGERKRAMDRLVFDEATPLTRKLEDPTLIAMLSILALAVCIQVWALSKQGLQQLQHCLQYPNGTGYDGSIVSTFTLTGSNTQVDPLLLVLAMNGTFNPQVERCSRGSSTAIRAVETLEANAADLAMKMIIDVIEQVGVLSFPDVIPCRVKGTHTQHNQRDVTSLHTSIVQSFAGNVLEEAAARGDIQILKLKFRISMLEDKHLEMGRVIVMTRALKTKAGNSKTQHFKQSPSTSSPCWSFGDELSELLSL